MQKNLQKTGHARIIWDKYQKFLDTEYQNAKSGSPSWYDKVYATVPMDIASILQEGYRRTDNFDRNAMLIPDEGMVKKIRKHQDYLDHMNLDWDLCYVGQNMAVLRSGTLTFGLPVNTVECFPYKGFDHIPLNELKAAAGDTSHSLIPETSVTKTGVVAHISKIQTDIASKEKEIASANQAMQEELQRIKAEIEAKYAEKMQILEEKKAALKAEQQKMEKQLFLLETEIYSIRCFMGETVDFIPICTGKHTAVDEPVIIYQELRYLDEELGKYLAIYGFDGTQKAYFEEILRNRPDLQEIFAPGEKSVSFVKVSRNKIIYCENDVIANTLAEYEVYHGRTIGIIIRDGKNIWMGWTDQDKINLENENIFLKPERKEGVINDYDLHTSSSKEEIASRYFIFHIIQGIIQSQKLFHLPESVDITANSPYVVLSMADSWLEDNRFGTFSDIVKRTNEPLQKGDYILTTLSIQRDDTYSSIHSRYSAWDNDRGRGEKNRTHDAYIPNRSILPINLIDTIKHYKVYYKKYRLNVKNVPLEGSVFSTYDTEETSEYLGMTSNPLTIENDKYYSISVKGCTPEEVYQAVRSANPHGWQDRQHLVDPMEKEESYYTIYDHTELDYTERECYLSATKSDTWGDGNGSRANMLIYNDEYLNLTYLNSVYIKYAIQNKKIGGWRRGNVIVDYANSIPYLNKAMEYLVAREKKEAMLLTKYIELYDEWQVDLSEWRLANGYHRLTDTRAKKFAKYVTSKNRK